MSNPNEDLRQLSAELTAALERIHGRDPRFRYFQTGAGPMFFWTVEKAGNDRYHSGVFQPVGKGSRSGKASAWQMDEDLYNRGHVLRKDAKARALKLFREWKEAQG